MPFSRDIRRLLQRDGSLDEADAAALWGAILDGAVDDVEVGAVLAALSVSGETREELAGLLRAARGRMVPWSPPIRGAMAIPAYDAIPGEALVVTLTVALLRRFDVPVIVHGVLDSEAPFSSARLLRAAGVMPCASLDRADEQLRAAGAVFVPLALVAPGMAALMALRGRLGRENAAHVVAQAVDPTHGAAVRIAFALEGAACQRADLIAADVPGDALSLSWSAGRSPLHLSVRPRIERLRDGMRELLFEADAVDARACATAPHADLHAAAAWISRVATGQLPVPVPFLNLVAACLYAVGEAADFSRAKAMAALHAGRLAA